MKHAKIATTAIKDITALNVTGSAVLRPRSKDSKNLDWAPHDGLVIPAFLLRHLSLDKNRFFHRGPPKFAVLRVSTPDPTAHTMIGAIGAPMRRWGGSY